MLTGDLNIADVEWVVQYRIINPVDYLFNVRNVQDTIRAASEAVMRRLVGDRSVTDVLTVGRVEIATLAQEGMQTLLDEYAVGISIVTVQLQDVNPPENVKAAFNEVNEAKQEKERITNQAWEAYNKAIPEAQGAAKKMISEAEGYRLQRVNEAKGDANRFTAQYNEYKLAKDVTRRRLYIEAMSDVLPKLDGKYIVDSDLKALLPLLDVTARRGGAQ